MSLINDAIVSTGGEGTEPRGDGGAVLLRDETLLLDVSTCSLEEKDEVAGDVAECECATFRSALSCLTIILHIPEFVRLVPEFVRR